MLWFFPWWSLCRFAAACRYCNGLFFLACADLRRALLASTSTPASAEPLASALASLAFDAADTVCHNV
jgi:hypothetical protein